MRQRIFLLILAMGVPAPLIGALGAGCGNSVVETDADASDGAGGQGNTPSSGAGVYNPDGGRDALPDYVDPGCPDAAPPPTMFTCDPYNQNSGDCPVGQGCFIYVKYPTQPCQQEVYGASCAPQGVGHQGDECANAQQCAGGFVCVVSGSGDQCVQLCPLMGAESCPSGLVCEPIDVEGFGGCL